MIYTDPLIWLNAGFLGKLFLWVCVSEAVVLPWCWGWSLESERADWELKITCLLSVTCLLLSHNGALTWTRDTPNTALRHNTGERDRRNSDCSAPDSRLTSVMSCCSLTGGSSILCILFNQRRKMCRSSWGNSWRRAGPSSRDPPSSKWVPFTQGSVHWNHLHIYSSAAVMRYFCRLTSPWFSQTPNRIFFSDFSYLTRFVLHDNLKIAYKQTKPQSHDFNVTTVKLCLYIKTFSLKAWVKSLWTQWG